MKDLQIFRLDNLNVRVYGEWFVGKDVAEGLGYAKTENAISRHVESYDRKTELIHSPRNGGGAQNTVLINESGVYALIFGSKLVSARKFKRWVTSDVLPSVRKHGAYMTPETLSQSFKDPAFLKGLLVELIETQNTVAELKPLAELSEAFLESDDTLSIAEYAKMLCKSGYLTGQNDLMRTLRIKKYLQHDNIPYQQYINQGIFSTVEAFVNGKMYITSRVTTKGQKYLLKKLRMEF